MAKGVGLAKYKELGEESDCEDEVNIFTIVAGGRPVISDLLSIVLTMSVSVPAYRNTS